MLFAFTRSVLFVATTLLYSQLLIAASTETALELRTGWVRAMPPGMAMSAAYFTIHNGGVAPVTVFGVDCDAGAASLHETRRIDGKMVMRSLEQLVVGPGETVPLSPGGLHVMITDIGRRLAEGDMLTLCLQTDSEAVCKALPVRRSAPTRDD